MKSSLPLKLGVVVLFAVVIIACLRCAFLTPESVEWSIGHLDSNIKSERIKAVRSLLYHGEKGHAALAEHFTDGPDAAQFLVKKWPDRNKWHKQKYELTFPCFSEIDPDFIIAVEEHWVQTAEFILSFGTDINVLDKHDRTALMITSRKQNERMAKMLLENGADVNAKDDTGWTPLHYATFSGCKTVAELLIAKGAEVNAKNKDGSTPLHYAAYSGSKTVAELLIEKGADVNAKASSGTPLYEAVIHGHKDIVVLLLSKGADVNSKTKYGFTALEWAILKNKKEIADLLRAHSGKTGEESQINPELKIVVDAFMEGMKLYRESFPPTVNKDFVRELETAHKKFLETRTLLEKYIEAHPDDMKAKKIMEEIEVILHWYGKDFPKNR